MKYILVPFMIFLLGCAEPIYVQVFDVKPTWENKKYSHVFENDTMKIEYSLWSRGGVFAFSIFNKLQVPIYVDWKNSSFIKNGDKFDYWSDEIVTKSHTRSRSRTSEAFSSFYSSSTGESTSVTTKKERITFIAPKSTIYKMEYALAESHPIRFSKDIHSKQEIPANYDANKTVQELYDNYTDNDSKMKFRNFLTFSTSEDISHKFYVDNGFYLQRVSQVSITHFFGKPNPFDLQFWELEKKYKSPYENNLRFFNTTATRQNQ